MKNNYNTEEWAKETSLGRHVFNFNFRMFGNEISGWELIDTVVMDGESGSPEIVYMWQKTGTKGNQLIRIGISEQNSWMNAHSALKNYLDNCMHPNFPRSKNSGDVSFASRQPKAKGSNAIVFTRGNMQISVNSVGNVVCEVSNIASKIDQLLYDVPKKASVDSKAAKVFRKKEATIKKRGKYAVIDAISQNKDKYGWMKIISPDGELIREGDSLIYKPDSIGKKNINVIMKKDDADYRKVVLGVLVQ
jgi:hypothetical protein